LPHDDNPILFTLLVTVQIHTFSAVTPAFICVVKQQKLRGDCYHAWNHQSKRYFNGPNFNDNIIILKAKIKDSQDDEDEDKEFYYNT
jgi:hypothetical protein